MSLLRGRNILFRPEEKGIKEKNSVHTRSLRTSQGPSPLQTPGGGDKETSDRLEDPRVKETRGPLGIRTGGSRRLHGMLKPRAQGRLTESPTSDSTQRIRCSVEEGSLSEGRAWAPIAHAAAKEAATY